MESEFNQVISLAGVAIEAFGVLIVVLGSCLATFRFLVSGRLAEDGDGYRRFRQDLGRSIILGLEFLIAGDIIRTVVVANTLENVGSLALIILIRTFLSMTLHLEVEGRWPWQRP